MARITSAQEFIELEDAPLFDVRTPAEFEHGHIPGAINLPLFTSEERIIIGTIYKQQGREPAILRGLELVGPKMRWLVEEVGRHTSGKSIRVYCWRGGMRSGSVSWLLDLYGYKVHTLKGGYKAFRNWALSRFPEPARLFILGGFTGSRKTKVLEALQNSGEQVIDLEGLAHHKGSSFGSIGETPPPTQEHFENELAVLFSRTDHSKTLWLEDESRTIGRKVIPEGLWNQMAGARLIFLHIPVEKRIEYLVEEYGKYPREQLEEATLRVRKRLGDLACREAIAALQEGNLRTTAEILLKYYDKTYLHGMKRRPENQVIHFHPISEKPEAIAKELVAKSSQGLFQV